jgi:hypothetical protein
MARASGGAPWTAGTRHSWVGGTCRAKLVLLAFDWDSCSWDHPFAPCCSRTRIAKGSARPVAWVDVSKALALPRFGLRRHRVLARATGSRNCDHTRRVYPQTLAAIAGWEARLEDIARRMRCTKCGKRECQLKPSSLLAPRGRGPSH